MPTLLPLAYQYAAAGLTIFPLKQDKKPYPGSRGFCDATTDRTTINDWWQRLPNSLIGLATGVRSGLLVIDLDVKNGKDGLAAFETLCAGREIGDPPFIQTPSGGAHLYFRHVVGARCSVDKLARGVDVRAEGGYVVLPDAERYLLLSGGPLEKAPDCPAWLADLILSSSSHASLGAATDDPYADQRVALTLDQLRIVAPDVASGSAWGSPGSRSNDLFRLALSLLARFPTLDPWGTAELFEASCAAVRAADAEHPDAAATTVEWVAQTLRRGIGYDVRRRERTAELQAEALLAFPGLAEADARARDIAEQGRLDRSGLGRPYTAEEIAAVPPMSWIVQAGSAYHLRAPDGDYVGPFTRDSLVPKARDLFAPAELCDPPAISLVVSQPTLRAKSAAELVRDYGVSILQVEYDYSLVRSKLDGPVFRRRCGGLAPLKAREHPEVAHWLSLLAGEQHGQLLDWLATILEIQRPTAAIYLQGAPGIGKSMLSLGLSRLWRRGAPCSFRAAVERFNYDMVESPLVFADEDLKLPSWGGETPANTLKRLVDENSRWVEGKYVGRALLHGAYRVVITTNKTPVELFNEALSAHDIAALGERVLVLEPRAEEASEYLQSLGGREYTERWVAGNAIAEHALWLAQTRRVRRGTRYLVQGAGFADLLAADGGGAREICLAVLRALQAAGEARQAVRDDSPSKPGTWVCSSLLHEHWRRLMPDVAVPEDWKDAMRAATEPNQSLTFKHNGIVRKYRLVRPSVLTRVAMSRGESLE